MKELNFNQSNINYDTIKDVCYHGTGHTIDMQRKLEDVPFDSAMGNDPILALVKYDLVAPEHIYPSDFSDEGKKMILDKIEGLTYQNNLFLDSALSNENLYRFLLKCIGEPEVVPLLDYVMDIYHLASYEFLKDMFCTMAVVLDPLTFVSIMCELYMAHIFLPPDENAYSFSAIFNLLFTKKSIERMFIEVIYRHAPYGIPTDEKQQLIFRMMKAIAYLNNHRMYVRTTYDEDYVVNDIFNVDEYIEKSIQWVDSI